MPIVSKVGAQGNGLYVIFLFLSAMSSATGSPLLSTPGSTTNPSHLELGKDFEVMNKETLFIIMGSVLGGIPCFVLLCCLLRACCAHLREKKVTHTEKDFVHPPPTHPPPRRSIKYPGLFTREETRSELVTPSFVTTAFAYQSMNVKPKLFA